MRVQDGARLRGARDNACPEHSVPSQRGHNKWLIGMSVPAFVGQVVLGPRPSVAIHELLLSLHLFRVLCSFPHP